MMKYRSSVNSVGDSETGSPAFQTSWVSSSSSMSAKVSRALRGSSTPRPDRRRITRSRATTSSRENGLVTKSAEQPEAVHAGHHHVEDDRIGAHFTSFVEGGGPVGRGMDLESLELQAHREELDDIGLVVYDEDPCLWGVLG